MLQVEQLETRALPSAELLALARKAVLAQEARKEEDVWAWAERLAREVGQLND